MLSVFIDELGSDFSEFVESTVDLLIPMVNFSTNDNIRKSVANCLPKLLKCVSASANKENKESIISNLARAFNSVLWTAICTEYEPGVIIE